MGRSSANNCGWIICLERKGPKGGRSTVDLSGVLVTQSGALQMLELLRRQGHDGAYVADAMDKSRTRITTQGWIT